MAKQVSNNPRKFLPALRTTNRDYTTLQALAVRIVAFMTTNIAFYATPNPALADVTTQKNALRSAIGLGGSSTNRASKTAVELIRAEAELLRSMIIALIAYAVNTATTDSGQQTQALYNFLLSGVSAKKEPRRTSKLLQSIAGFKIVLINPIDDIISLSWSKPNGLFKGKGVAIYQVEVQNPETFEWFTLSNTTKTTITFGTESCPFEVNLNNTLWRIRSVNSNGFSSSYMFKLKSAPINGNGISEKLNGTIAATNGFDYVPLETVPFAYNTLNLRALDSGMNYYLSTAPNIAPDPLEPAIAISPGSPGIYSIEALKTILHGTVTRKFLNVQNTGAPSGRWEVIAFIA